MVPTMEQRRRATSDFETNMTGVSDGDRKERRVSWRKKERRCNGVAGRTRPQDEGGRKDSNRGLEAALAIILAGQLMAWRRPITAACFVLRRCQARLNPREGP